MDKKQIILTSIIFLCAINMSGAVKIISVNHISCNYTVNIPDGWDTIPNSILKEKSGLFPYNMGIYPVAQKDYFSGN